MQGQSAFSPLAAASFLLNNYINDKYFILLHLTELGLGGRRGLHDDEQRDALRAPNDGGGGSSGMGHPQRCRSVCLQYRKAKLLASL